ncbi:unnamed protein product [Acanthoscelides obtectus]|uniref:DDE Tnp4 domain-containing protein n=1 Tax=Acanthoscelides obtectus TaxID=200917 RepID=A0A9P0JJ00_ACAOB|nr:unnamed protein product [Acanthoscelides obtectus]CAK1639846.1 hypothetical protein AOBTE_LOCUS11408 [Acanthoscelides obtectus]
MAIANAKKEFIMVDIGCNGRVLDGGVIFYTKFWEQQCRLNLPEPSPLPNTLEPYPYVFVGDEAFALGPNLVKPYPEKTVIKEEEIYNQPLSKARCVVECAVGILVTKFGVFHKAISLCPEKATKVTAARCYLHNYLLKKDPQMYASSSSNSDEFDLMTMQRSMFRNSAKCAKTIRDKFCIYYNNEVKIVNTQL